MRIFIVRMQIYVCASEYGFAQTMLSVELSCSEYVTGHCHEGSTYYHTNGSTCVVCKAFLNHFFSEIKYPDNFFYNPLILEQSI